MFLIFIFTLAFTCYIFFILFDYKILDKWLNYIYIYILRNLNDINLLDLDLHLIKNYFTDFRLVKLGYDIEACVLPTAPNMREVWGSNMSLLLTNNIITLTFEPKWSYFAAKFVAIEFLNYGEIYCINLNDKTFYKHISINEFINLKGPQTLKIYYKNELDAADSANTIYFIVSPWRGDFYYLNLGLDAWAKNIK